MDSEIYLTIIILTIALIIIIYTLYYYYSHTKETLLTGMTYLPKDLVNEEPIFKEQVGDVIECTNRCVNDPLCNGITYDTDSNMCSGTTKGRLRKDGNHLIAWEKSEKSLANIFKKTLIVGFASNSQIVDKNKIPQPSMNNEFTYSFGIIIKDHYHNFEYWKHILHKGTQVDGELSYRQWDDVVRDYDDQYIGVWIAPFTNNIRISITTRLETPEGSYKQSEYTDLVDIPINKKHHISVSFKGERIMEVYTNGNLIKSVQLNGEPEYNYGDLYIKQNKSFNGSIYNLNHIAIPVSHTEIRAIYQSGL
jgi:hypothetical protein